MSIKRVKQRVLHQLKSKDSNRDNDRVLLANIWYGELVDMDINPQELSAKGFLKLLAEDKLSNPVSLWRCRQLLQEQNEELRGKSYKGRKAKEPKIRDEVKDKSWQHADMDDLIDMAYGMD